MIIFLVPLPEHLCPYPNSLYPTSPSLFVCGCVHEPCFNISGQNTYGFIVCDVSNKYCQPVYSANPQEPSLSSQGHYSPSPYSWQALQSAIHSLPVPTQCRWCACSSLDVCHVGNYSNPSKDRVSPDLWDLSIIFIPPLTKDTQCSAKYLSCTSWKGQSPGLTDGSPSCAESGVAWWGSGDANHGVWEWI